MKKKIQQSLIPAISAIIVVMLVILAFQYEILPFGKQKDVGTEIADIKLTNNLEQRIGLYRKLIERVGPVEAQDRLYRSGLPFDGETHLLNHTSGDYLYEKFGAAGLTQCRDYFLSSCYHGFLLHVIADGGLPKVEESYNACLKEGMPVATQCAHAIGHGFLANLGYKNLTKALEACDEAASTMQNFPSFNCYDGIFMENIWAVHDGEPSPDRWVKPEDPQYPCNDPRIDSKYLLGCWSNQPSLAYQLFRGDIKKVGELCGKVKVKEFQTMCFDGLARQIHPITGGSVEKTFQMCGLMPNQQWTDYCLNINARSAYSVGDRVSPFNICGVIRTEAKQDCYNMLLSIMQSYSRPGEDMMPLCAKITDANWRNQCETVF